MPTSWFNSGRGGIRIESGAEAITAFNYSGPRRMAAGEKLQFNVRFLLTPFLQKVGLEKMVEMRSRVAAEIKTTFASHYSKEVSLHEALSPKAIAAYGKQATGEKYLITP